jgi:excisionase family DNA binding protein
MNPRRYYTSQETADYLGISVDALRKRVERGEIPHHKLGRRTWFRIDDIDDLMNEHRVEAWTS